ncbi:MAG: hypothetical protein E3J70_10930 [Candidatus Heimdallarchaeota archaeon]|nr:MAG: hypothetical protein E3J70_10930 [Candidatus Heimdallarchaeota archaeon]
MADRTPFLVINPHANEGKAEKMLEEILTTTKKVLGDFEYGVTTKLGDGIPIAKQAAKDGYKTILAVGGDGTLNEVVNVVANTDIKIGMVPTGGSCDAYQTHAIPLNLKRSLEIVASGYSEKFSGGLAKGDSSRYFIDMVNSGLAGYVNEIEPTWGKPRLKGDLRYSIMAIDAAFKYKAVKSKILVDDQEREVNLAYFSLGLSDTVAGYELIPGNHPKKGKLGVVIIRDLKNFRLVSVMLRLMFQSITRNKHAEILYGKKVIIESEKPMTWVAEGEIFSQKSKKVEVEFVPDIVNLIIPEGYQYEYSSKEKKRVQKAIKNGNFSG